MRKRTAVGLITLSLALTACASKTPKAEQLPPAMADEAPYSDPRGADTARLQADLAASAGSDRVLFELDSAVLTPVARQILTAQFAWLQRHPEVSFTIEGHCDERGTREYNLALGDRRARAAAAFLTALGLSPSRLRTISYGKERPEALSADEAAYAQNRRAVSIVINGS